MRRTAVALAVVAALSTAALGSAAGTRGASRVVRTWNCTTNPQPVEEAVRIAESQGKVSIATGSASSPDVWLGFRRDEPGFDVGSRCRPVARHVVMSLNELEQSSVTDVACAAPHHVLLKLVMTESDANGTPLDAKIEITQPHSRFKPLGQVVWSSDGYTLYVRRAACAAQ